MPAKRRTSKQPNSAAVTPLDAKQRALREQEELIKRKQEKLERMIQEAPVRAAAERKRNRDELVARNTGRSRRVDAPTRLDTRYNTTLAETAPHFRRKPLRAEQRQARLIFCGLLVALAVLLLWLWSVWKW
jgi:Flp pilus assembly protein TadB